MQETAAWLINRALLMHPIPQDDDEKTALHIAAEKGFLAAVTELLKRGSDITATDKVTCFGSQ